MLKPKRRCSFPAFVIAPEAFQSGSKSESVERGRRWSRVSTVSLDRPADRRALPRNRLWCCDTVSPHQNGTRTNTTPKLKELVEAFKKLGDQKLRVQQLLHMAATLPPFPRERRVLGNRVRGCLSVVHVDALPNKEGKIDIMGDSDSQLTKGLVAFLIHGLSGYTAEEICAVSPEFIKDSGLSISLTPGRTNGFLNMLKTMQEKAKLLKIGSPDNLETSAESDLSVRERVEKRLQILKPESVVIRDDSAKHRGHEGAHVRRGETHFTIKIVSDIFKDLPDVKRHQLVYALLNDELSSRKIHALSIITLTTAEAHDRQGSL